MLKKGGLLDRIWRNRIAYLFLLPIMSLVFVFKYYSFGVSVFKSFFKWNGANINVFCGIENYLKLFTDSYIQDGLVNVFIITAFYVLIGVTMPLLIAELIFNLKSVRMQGFFRMTFIIPMVVPMMVTVLLWKWMYAGDYGIINQALTALGLEAFTRAWIGQAETALGAVIFMGFPWLGLSMVGGMHFLVYFAGLQNISMDLFEAAKIDGAKFRQRFLYIDLPLIKSQLKLMISFSIINGLQSFLFPYVLTNGGPGSATMVPAIYMYMQAFEYSNMGYASAIGVVLFVIILVFTGITNRLLKDSDD